MLPDILTLIKLIVLGIQLSKIHEWKIVWKAFSKESDREEKGRLRAALCLNRRPWIIKQ